MLRSLKHRALERVAVLREVGYLRTLASMDAATVREMLQQQFEHAGRDPELSHAMYHRDAVLEFPQSGERFEGVENFRAWRSEYPAETTFEIREVRGGADVWVVELTVTYDDGPKHYGVSILELRDGKIARESIYVAEGWDPPEWRAKWRAAT
jgi:SnoaL-like domain